MAVNFYQKVEDQLMKFAVIISKTEGKYVFCKHKDRDTLEAPEATENGARRFWTLPKENCTKKPEPLTTI